MMILQNASAISKQDSSFPFIDDHDLPLHPEENEYENVETIRSCKQNLLPVPSPYRNIEISHPKAPHPTPCPRPTSTSACFFTTGGSKTLNHPNFHEQVDPSPTRNYHCHTHSDCVNEDNPYWRPVFFSPQPQKPELPPSVNPHAGKKLRQSVKRAVSDGHAQIKTTKNRTRKSFNERKKCLPDSGSNNNSNRRG